MVEISLIMNISELDAKKDMIYMEAYGHILDLNTQISLSTYIANSVKIVVKNLIAFKRFTST